MAHIGGLWLPGCLALAVLVSLVHSQHGKGGLEAGTDRQTGMWARGLGSPGSTKNTAPAPSRVSAHGVQLREGAGCSGLDRQGLLLLLQYRERAGADL